MLCGFHSPLHAALPGHIQMNQPRLKSNHGRVAGAAKKNIISSNVKNALASGESVRGAIFLIAMHTHFVEDTEICATRAMYQKVP